MRISHQSPVLRACPRAGGGQFALTLVIALILPGQIIVSEAAQNSDLLEQGLDLIAEQDTSGALATFSRADGPDVAAHYNSGTLALESGNLGAARYHLETASRLAPFSELVTHNLSLAYERLGINQRPGLFTKTWRWTVGRVGLVGLVIVTLALYFALLALLSLKKRRPTRRTTLATILVGCLAIAFLSFSIAALWNTQRPEAIVVANEEVPLRTIPNPDAASQGALQPGHSVQLLYEEARWAKVQTRNHTFWVPSRAIKQLPF